MRGRSVSWQAEVEDFVREVLFDWRYAPLAQDNDPRVLMLFHAKSNELIGIAAHERIILQARDLTFSTTKLEVVATTTNWQSRTFKTGERASDVLMSAVMADVVARVPPRAARVMAVVHEDNVRSIKLCRKHGFTEELSRPDQLSKYRRLMTEHMAAAE
jgi:hypothetical protein